MNKHGEKDHADSGCLQYGCSYLSMACSAVLCGGGKKEMSMDTMTSEEIRAANPSFYNAKLIDKNVNADWGWVFASGGDELRARAKEEFINFAMVSALTLSITLPLLLSPPDLKCKSLSGSLKNDCSYGVTLLEMEHVCMQPVYQACSIQCGVDLSALSPPPLCFTVFLPFLAVHCPYLRKHHSCYLRVPVCTLRVYCCSARETLSPGPAQTVAFRINVVYIYVCC